MEEIFINGQVSSETIVKRVRKRLNTYDIYRIYVDVMTEENLSLILRANMDLIYYSDRSSSREGEGGVKGRIVILALCVFHFL